MPLDIVISIPEGSTLKGSAIINGFIDSQETDPLIILKALIRIAVLYGVSAITEKFRNIKAEISLFQSENEGAELSEELQLKYQQITQLYAIAQRFSLDPNDQERVTKIILARGTTQGYILNDQDNYVLPGNIQDKIIELVQDLINDSFLLNFVNTN